MRGIGTERSFEIFQQTAEIQYSGGQIAMDGNYKYVNVAIYLLNTYRM